MADHRKEDGYGIPKCPAEPGEKYRLWRAKVIWHESGVPEERRKLYPSRLISEALPDSAAELFQHTSPDTFKTLTGFHDVLSILDKHYGAFPEIEMVEVTQRFFYHTSRKSGESTAAYAARFKLLASRLEAVVSAELLRESKRLHEDRNKVYRERIVGHLLAQAETNQAISVFDREEARLNAALTVAAEDEDARQVILEQMAALGERPSLPEPPAKPVAPTVEKFSLPGILKGALFLSTMGLSQGR